MNILDQSFYNRSSIDVARDLIGKKLVGRSGAAGTIIETEAYTLDDPASHSYGGKRARNAPMFGPAGHAYVYFIYGRYWCFNCVTEPGSAALIRALIPTESIEVMKTRRGKEHLRELCSGPAKLVQALGLRPTDNGLSLYRPSDEIKIYHDTDHENIDVRSSTRIGITKAVDRPWRFGLYDSPYLSQPL